MMDFIPEEHTLLMVVQGTLIGRPPLMAACLAGAWPIPAETTFPRTTSSTFEGGRWIDSRRALMQKPARSVAECLLSLPLKEPMGVRLPSTR